jgi:hypothetical protein
LLAGKAWDIAKAFMTKTLEKRIDRTIRRKREELVDLREEIEDLIDYLDILEVRVRDAGKPRLNHAEVKKRYGLK